MQHNGTIKHAGDATRRGNQVHLQVMVCLSQLKALPSPGNLGQIFRNGSNPSPSGTFFGQMPHPWVNSIGQIPEDQANFSTLNNHVTLRLQKESFFSSNGRAF